jgi:putative phosphoesterase
MKIGIMSDSHDHFENIKKGIAKFRDKKVDYIIHLGDFVNPGSIKLFQGIKFVGIFGNNDGDKFRLISAFSEIGGEIKGDFYEFEEDAVKFACYHGTELQIKDSLINCQKYDIVLFGHTHRCLNITVGKTIALNPGTTHGFGDKATIAVFDTKTRQAEFISL